MKPPTPTFSERYKAHVEAERQYVTETAQAKGSTPIQGATQADGENGNGTTIEQAFHLVRSQNRRNPPLPPDTSEVT